MLRISAITSCLLLAVTVNLFPQAVPEKTSPPVARPADVADPDAIIAALYNVISGPAGQPRDWNRFRSLFAAGARLVPVARNAQTGEIGSIVLDPEGYMGRSAERLEKNGFYEKEIARRTERFGTMLHAFSTYESRHKAEDASPFARGINSIQLYHDGKRWWIVTVMWQAETPEYQLPRQYLRTP